MMTKGGPRFLLIALLWASGCANSAPAELGGETNWLRECSADEKCDADLACTCGLCSKRCSNDDDCGEGLRCNPAESALVQNACSTAAVFGMCSPECERDADCARGQACVEGACAPRAAVEQQASAAPPGAGAPQAFAVAVVQPDTSCVYAGDNAIMTIGLLDIAAGGTDESTSCAHGYRVHLKVASNEPGVLQLSGASVQLMNRDMETLVFDGEDATLDNPFTFSASRTLIPAAAGEAATGVVEIEVVRSEYQRYLADFVGDQLLAAIRLQATDAADAAVVFRPFLYPIEICDGCLTTCESVLPPDITRMDVTQGQCDDNSGADGRICFDPDC